MGIDGQRAGPLEITPRFRAKPPHESGKEQKKIMPRKSLRANAPSMSVRRRRGQLAANDDESSDSDGVDEAPAAAPEPVAASRATTSTRPSGRRLSMPTSPTRRNEPLPDHYYKPSLGARLVAAARRLCGDGDPYFLSRHQVASSTRLQMIMTFNVYVSCAYALLHPLIFQWKANTWEPSIIIAVCSPMFFYVWLVMEPIRLMVGYVGNLGERVAWLAPFWILTLFPQIITQFYFLFGQSLIGWVTLPIEYVLHCTLMVLYLTELFMGYSSGKRLVIKAAADYHLQPVVPIDVAEL